MQHDISQAAGWLGAVPELDFPDRLPIAGPLMISNIRYPHLVNRYLCAAVSH